MMKTPGYLALLFLLASTSCAQRPTPLAIPLAMEVCDEPGAAPLPCQFGLGQFQAGLWTFNGQQGLGVWTNPIYSVKLTVERFDTGGVIIHRNDPGRVIVYQGTVQGNMISGTTPWRDVNGSSGVGKWFARIGTPQEQLAQVQQQQQVLQQIQVAQQQQQRNQATGEMAALGMLLMGLSSTATLMPESGDVPAEAHSHVLEDRARADYMERLANPPR